MAKIRNCFLIFLFILFCSFGSKAYPADKINKKKSLELTEIGWRIMENKSNEQNKARFANHCDASEMGQKYFRQAVLSDPANASAWYGWGKAIAYIDACYNQSSLSWNEKYGFEYYDKMHNPYIAPLGASLEATEKFRKASELDPLNASYLEALGHNLLLSATVENKMPVRHLLLKEGMEKYNEAVRIKNDEPDLHRQFAKDILAVLPLEDDEKTWKDMLNKALEQLDIYKAMSAAVKNNGRHNASMDILEDILAPVFTRNMTNEKNSALASATRQRVGKFEDLTGEGQKEAFLIVNILLALIEDDPKIWQEELSKATDQFEQHYLNRMTQEGLPEYFSLKILLFLGQLTTSVEKQQAVANAALKMYHSIATLSFSKVEEANILFINRDKNDCLASIEASNHNAELRNKIIDELRRNYIKAKSEADKKMLNQLDVAWAETLLRLASSAKSDEQFNNLVQEADDIFLRILSESKLNYYFQWVLIYNIAIEAEQNPQRRIVLLEKLMNTINKYAPVNMTMAVPTLRGSLKGSIYYKLALLEKNSSKRRHLIGLAINEFSRFLILDNDSGYRNSRKKENELFYITFLTNIAFSKDGTRQDFVTAMSEFRKFIAAMPDLLENIDPEFMYTTYLPDKKFKDVFTTEVSVSLQRIYETYKLDEAEAWQLTQLADLHRYLAFSGLLSDDYKELYLERAENYLRRAVTINIQDDSDSHSSGTSMIMQKDRREPADSLNNPVRDKALAMSALGLLLAERMQLENKTAAANFKETEKLWKEAEEMSKNSSFYAKARYYARKGDVQNLKKYLTHSYSDFYFFDFPSFATAKDDPAFMPYIAEPWFKKCWYGLAE